MESKLYNGEEDRVKVIIVPEYLDGNDSFFKREYYDIVSGMDLGVFPSFYEPWGYTPLESIYFGVPTVTTDLAGFGLFTNKYYLSHGGVKVLKRDETNKEESINNLFSYFVNFLNIFDLEKIKLKGDAKSLSKEYSWKKFAKNYIKAYEIARDK